ncbi:E3 ubiquitin-protein ligase RNF14 isoform X2 [Cryptotermes secundus]|uniref:E3 ubiquitin-protein ligase RNF14 isoform X2 n=1 Tax=Cryptotermes secundus TaxID=105785 RepID=UPI000CD7BFF5|nr:E3 ubiquitin-protein ligase RNF14 isoform X2 [Cryptotermes secundus]
MSNKESQRDEICVLESIYNEEEIQIHEENNLLGGQFYAYIDLPTGFKVVFRDLREEDSCLEELPLKYLPPISLHFSLPCDYPSRSSPTYTLSCQWLQNNKLILLHKKLEAIWKENEGMEVLFLWTQFLKEDVLKFLEITDTLDVSSLETTYKKREEFRQAMRTHQLEEREKRKNAKSETESGKQLNTPDTCRSVAEYPRRKQRGRTGWGRKDRVVDQHKEDELKSESCALGKTETIETSTQNTGTVQDNSCNTDVLHDSKNQRAGSCVQRSSHRGTYGKGYSSNYNRSPGRGNNWMVSGNSYRSVSPKSNDQIGLNINNPLINNESIKNSSECDNVVDRQCNKNSEAVNIGNASEDCIVGTKKKDVEVALNGVGVKPSKSTVFRRKHNSQPVPSTLNRDRRYAPTRPRMSVVKLLREYDEARQRTEFNRNFYTCKICFQDKRGSHCTCFEGCGHVFCKSCMAEYFAVRIKDGTVKSICCPEENCTSEAVPNQVQELVSAELFSRYDSVLLSTLLDTMEDVLYCPRPACQYPVAVEPGEKMAACPSCSYVFCIYCRMVYHGIEPCRFRAHEKRHLVEEYSNASEERRVQMEQRYGKKQLQTLVDTSLSEIWVFTNSKKCPSCNAAIEKSEGCNKMVCWKCNTSFCWLCEQRLNPERPYLHFNNPASKCYNLLFHGVQVSDEEDDWWEAEVGEEKVTQKERGT